MQRRMLAIAVLATVAATTSIAAAQAATSSKTAVAQGFVYGGVTASEFPVVIELSKSRKKVVRASIGLDLKCQTPGGDLMLPDSFKNIPIAGGKFSSTYGPQDVPGDALTPISKLVVTGSITGKVNKAKTTVKGTWRQKVVAIAASDPTGATILDTCDSGVVSYSAKQ
jgi:secreted PhoX family phosphatase